MSYHVYFGFSRGISKAIKVPVGTVAACQRHVAEVTQTLGFEVTRYKRNPPHWSRKMKDGVTDEVLCDIAQRHNAWVRWFYDRLTEWSKTPPTGELEKMTPRDARSFWHGLEDIRVPPERWTESFYRDRMEHLYEVMRGRESEGVSFDEKPLTPRQAAMVINLFSFIDPGDQRLDVPKGRDHLASSEDGGYAWCEKCGAVDDDYEAACRKRGCPLRAEREAGNR